MTYNLHKKSAQMTNAVLMNHHQVRCAHLYPAPRPGSSITSKQRPAGHTLEGHIVTSNVREIGPRKPFGLFQLFHSRILCADFYVLDFRKWNLPGFLGFDFILILPCRATDTPTHRM